MKKLFFILLICAPSVFAQGLLIQGSMNLNARLQDTSFSADFGTEFIQYAQRSYPLLIDEQEAGSVHFEIRFDEKFTAGNLRLEHASHGRAVADAAEDRLVFENLNWLPDATQLGEWRTDQGFEKTFYGRVFEEDEGQVGSFSVHVRLLGLEQGSNSFDVGGSGRLDAQMNYDFFQGVPNLVTNRFAGFVQSRSGLPVTSGYIYASSGDTIGFAKLEKVGSKGGFGFNGAPLTITGLQGASVDFYIGTEKVKTVELRGETATRRLDLEIAYATSPRNFADFDKDGVPNDKDECPNTFNAVVNAQGCSCGQLMKLHNNRGRCVVTADKGPVWIPPPPPPIIAPQCPAEYNNTCLPELPNLCTQDLQVVSDCGRCGCRPGYECDPVVDGEQHQGCVKVVEQINLSCFRNNYHAGPFLDCSTLNESFYDFFSNPRHGNLNKYVFVDVSANYFAGSKARAKARREIRKRLSQIRICIETEKLGCVNADTKCPGEVEFFEDFETVKQEMQTLFNRFNGDPRATTDADYYYLASAEKINFVAGSGSSYAWYDYLPFGPTICTACAKVRARLGFNPAALTDVSLRLQEPCDSVVLEEDECEGLEVQGHEQDKFDLFFIGDGFSNQSVLDETVRKLLDLNESGRGTRDEGLFSIPPFTRKQINFNIWSKNVSSMPRVQAVRVQDGFLPDRSQVEDHISGCIKRDLTVVLTKGNPYKSQCVSHNLCFFSFESEPYPGRALAQLIGEAFGVVPEYFFPITPFSNPNSVAGLSYLGISSSPNCAKDRFEAEQKWGDIADNVTVGYFEGCGGVCNERCAAFLRSTFNSVMRNASSVCDGKNCRVGPPFDGFNRVSEDHLRDRLIEFNDPLRGAPFPVIPPT